MSAVTIYAIIVAVFVFMIMITILSILLLVQVSVRVHNHNHSLSRTPRFSIFHRSKESLNDDSTVFISPSRPTVVGRPYTKGHPVMHITVTPPTPVRLPSGHIHDDEIHKLSPR